MKFLQKLITPVLATVLLIGGAAVAQDAVMGTLIASDGEIQDGWLFEWRYDADSGVFEWGDPECLSATEVAPVTTEDDGGLAEAAEPTGSNCYSVDLTEPRHPKAADEDAEDPDGSDTEINHGDLVSRAAHEVKDNPLPEDAKNRGSIISRIARETKDLFGSDDPEDSETELEEVEEVEVEEVEDESDDESGPPDHANKDKDEAKEPPAKAKGKNK